MFGSRHLYTLSHLASQPPVFEMDSSCGKEERCKPGKGAFRQTGDKDTKLGKRSGKLLASNHRVQKHSVVSQQGAESWRTQKQPGAVYKTKAHGKLCLDESAASSEFPGSSRETHLLGHMIS